MLAFPGKDPFMKNGRQGCAFSSGSQIGHSEITHHRHAQQLCQIGRLTQLKGGRVPAAGMVKDSLTMQADQLWSLASRCAQSVASINSPQIMMQLRQLIAVHFALGGCVEALANCPRK